MAHRLKIDIVSDIVCPWCAIGVAGLEQALTNLAGEIEADLAFHPFELNPGLPPGGENGLGHVARKYGISPDQVRTNRAAIAERAAAVGFAMNVSDETRIVNTFDAHRLIAWAGEHGSQPAMERKLLASYFTDQRDISDPGILVDAAATVGLDAREARRVLVSDAYAEQVRADEARWQARGITGVPAFVVADRHLIAGGQPPEEFERRLRGIVAREGGDGDA